MHKDNRVEMWTILQSEQASRYQENADGHRNLGQRGWHRGDPRRAMQPTRSRKRHAARGVSIWEGSPWSRHSFLIFTKSSRKYPW